MIATHLRGNMPGGDECAGNAAAAAPVGSLGGVTKDHADHRPPHALAAEAAMRAETVSADAASRTSAFHVRRGVQAPEAGTEGPGIIARGAVEPEVAADAHPEGPVPARIDVTALVLTVSDRCAAGEREDRSGPLAAELLAGHGIEAEVRVVPDGDAVVHDALEDALAEGFRFILTTGGTGVGPRDRTPEGTRSILDLEMPGVAQAMRDAGALGETPVPAAVLSRGLAGIALVEAGTGHGGGGAFVVNAPGSTGGVRDAVGVVGPLVAHVLGQLDGGDH